MLKADYNEFLDTYIAFEQLINQIINDSEAALEADGVTPANAQPAPGNAEDATAAAKSGVEDTTQAVNNAKNATRDTVKNDDGSDQVQKAAAKQKLIQRIEKLLKAIQAIVENLARSIQNNLRKLMLTDKGFQKQYYRQKAMVKPEETVRVISYQYNNDVVNTNLENLLKDTVDCLKALTIAINNPNGGSLPSGRVSEILGANAGNMMNVLFGKYTKGNTQINSPAEYTKYILEQFRGEKRTFEYNQTQLPAIEKAAMTSREIEQRLNGYVRQAEQAYNEAKKFLAAARSTAADDESLQKISTNASKASLLYNAYNAFVNCIYNMKVEQALNYRVILRKFYKF